MVVAPRTGRPGDQLQIHCATGLRRGLDRYHRLAHSGGIRSHVTKDDIEMKYLNSNFGRMIAIAVVSLAIGLCAGRATAGQPDMDNALASLQSAESYLNLVTQDKGGHAAAARHLVEKAIVQVQEGIAFGEAQGE